MNKSRSEPRVAVSTALPANVSTELIIAPVFEDDLLSDSILLELDEASDGEVGRAI